MTDGEPLFERRRFLLAAGGLTITSMAGCTDVFTDDLDSATPTPTATPFPGEMQLTTVSSPTTVEYDADATLTVGVQNPGEQSTTQPITVEIAGETHTTDPITLGGAGESETVDITIPADVTFDGEYEIHVATEDDDRTTSMRVENPNPYGEETLIVGLEQQAPARHDMEEVITDALAYWESNSKQYAGYPIVYEYRPNTEDPDVLIRVVEEIPRCGGHSGEIAGCAPLVTDSAPSPVEIRVVAGYRQDWLTETLKHELGHTLGLGHDDEPAHIMSNEIEDRIPNYEDRVHAFDLYVDSFDPYERSFEAWDDMLDALGDRDYVATESAAVTAHNERAEAAAHIEAAERMARQLNEVGAEVLFNESYTHVETLRLAAEAAIEMAREAAARHGDPAPHRDQANRYRDEAYTYEFHSSSDVAFELGLSGRR